MKRSRFSEEQMIGILKEHEAGVTVADLCRKYGASVSEAKWLKNELISMSTLRRKHYRHLYRARHFVGRS
ncbi:putative transposase [Nitrobacteraceae bacterium AZCC 2161]